jgi:hypothetical protein
MESPFFPFIEGERYSRDHILPDQTIINFVWTIPVLEDLIIKNKLHPIKRKIGPLVEWIDFPGLVQDRLQTALTNEKPVYVIDYAPSNLEILIDGNHRVASRYLISKNPNRQIASYLIPAKIHVKALSSDFQRVMFKVLSNMGRINIYVDSITNSGKGKKPQLFIIQNP